VSGALVVSEILGTKSAGCHRSARGASQPDKEAVWVIAERIAAEVDRVLSESAARDEASAGTSAQCACSAPVRGGTLVIRGTAVSVPGLPLIFEQCAERGIPADETGGAALLDAVKIYHGIPPEEEADYQVAVLAAYRDFRSAAQSDK
jgi:hypothetical protein